MADLVVGNRPLFLIGQDGIFLLITGDDNLDAFFQIGLCRKAAPIPDGAKRCFVYDVGKLRAGSTGGHTGDFVEIYVFRYLDLFCMDFQDGFPAQQVGQFHRNPTIETSGAGQCRVQRFRPVGSRQNNDAVVAFKTVHFGQQLIEGLLSLVVAADLSVAFFYRWRRFRQ